MLIMQPDFRIQVSIEARCYEERQLCMLSVGVILYILLSGVPPFWEVTEQGVSDVILCHRNTNFEGFKSSMEE